MRLVGTGVSAWMPAVSVMLKSSPRVSRTTSVICWPAVLGDSRL